LKEIGPSLPGETPHPDIQEILAKRREMLNRVRADLKKVDALQSEFWREGDKPALKPTENS
jgi:hypothetical protein